MSATSALVDDDAITLNRVPLKDMDLHQLRAELVHYAQRRYYIEDYDSTMREMLFAATQLCIWAHRNQTRLWRNDTPRTPYTEHPMRCALRLIRAGQRRRDNPGYEMIVVALLHDVIEDCAEEISRELVGDDAALWPRTEESMRLDALGYIARQFSPSVSEEIEILSAPLSQKKIGYLEHIQHLVRTGKQSVLLVKASDQLDNAGSLRHQYGHVDDAMIEKLVRKYLPSTQMLIDAIQREADEHQESAVLRDIAEDLRTTHQHLLELARILEID